MVEKFKTFNFLLVFLTFNFLLLTLSSPVFADCDPNLGECPAGLPEIEQVFTRVISVVAGLGFVILLVMLVAAGFKYLTSGGEPKAVAAAHQTVTWALLGIVFMAVAWIILQLIKSFTGIDVTFFSPKILPELK